MGTQGIKMDYETAKNLAIMFIEVTKSFYRNTLYSDVKVTIAGSLRRNKKENIGDVDLIVCSDDKTFDSRFLNELTSNFNVTSAGGRTVHLLDEEGHQVDLYACSNDEYVGMLNYLTGSQRHNIKLRSQAKRRGMKLNQYGLFDSDGDQLDIRSEEELYLALGMKYVYPQYR